jgi:hypothetical protein
MHTVFHCAGVVLSLDCSGFLAYLLRARTRLATTVAGIVSSLPVLVALAALMLQPVTGLTGSPLAGKMHCLQGMSVGFNLFVALRLLPATSQTGRGIARMAAAQWALSGALAGVVGCAGMVVLCLGTPYCLTM